MSIIDEIKGLIETNIAGARATINSPDEVHFDAVIITDAFESLTKIKRQQLVYDLLKPLISSGRIHAISLKTYTVKESQAI